VQESTVVTIGTFDGVHIGHQAILRELRCQADQVELPTVAFAFSVPPRWVMRAEDGRYLLLPTSAKLDLLGRSVDRVIPASFRDVQAMSPEEFARSVLVSQLHARVVVEGEAFRFGCDRSGDMAALRSLGDEMGFDVVGVPPVVLDGDPVSSSRIRAAIASNRFSSAESYLGRPPFVLGEIVHGHRVGSDLGYPTANMAVDPHVLLPPDGIFLVRAFLPGLTATGLLYIGSRPTFGGSDRSCEVHLLDVPPRSLYGEPMEVHLLERIRDDRFFSSPGALRAQIEADIASARDREARYPRTEAQFVS
jgi:riboflavin kinase/FMN adenylyltransferase